MNCKEFHIEVESGLRDTRLSASAHQHAADCPPCHEFNNEHVEFREWLSVCEKITAPKDFQFGVQRKIASSGAANSQDRIWRGLRYIVPSAGMAAVLALGISYGFNYQTVAPNPVATAMTNTQFAPKDANVPATDPVQKIDTPPVQDNEKTIAVANTNAAKPENNSRVAVPVAPKVEDKVPGGGSLESTVKDSAASKLPEGINLPASGAANRSNTLLAAAKLGVFATSTDLKVNGFKPGSAAANSGIQLGDVIEGVSGNTVTVNRGGQKMTFTLK